MGPANAHWSIVIICARNGDSIRIGIHSVIMMIGILGGISVMGMTGVILGPLFIALLISSYLILIDKLTLIKKHEL